MEIFIKKIILVSLLITGSFANSNVAIKNLKTFIKDNNKQEIANLILYPLKRSGYIPDIKNKKDFINRYDEIFDKKFKNMILNSEDKDWTMIGSRGPMFKDGLIWLGGMDKIINIYYYSEWEKNQQKKLLQKDKNSLHKSLSNFENNILTAVTKNFRIRIDEFKKNTYRYTVWDRGESKNVKADLVLNNGTKTYEGSGGNHYYTFLNGDFKYIVDMNILGYDDSIGDLKVYKKNKLILKEKIEAKVKNLKYYDNKNIEEVSNRIEKQKITKKLLNADVIEDKDTKTNKKEIDTTIKTKKNTIITKDELLPKKLKLTHNLLMLKIEGESAGSFASKLLITSLKAEKIKEHVDGSITIDHSPIKVTNKHMDELIQQCKDTAKMGNTVRGSNSYKVFFYSCASAVYASLNKYLIEEWETGKILFSDE